MKEKSILEKDFVTVSVSLNHEGDVTQKATFYFNQGETWGSVNKKINAELKKFGIICNYYDIPYPFAHIPPEEIPETLSIEDKEWLLLNKGKLHSNKKEQSIFSSPIGQDFSDWWNKEKKLMGIKNYPDVSKYLRAKELNAMSEYFNKNKEERERQYNESL